MIVMKLRIKPISVDLKCKKTIEQAARQLGILPYFTKYNGRYIAILTNRKINIDDTIVVKEEHASSGDVVLLNGVSTVWGNFLFKKLQFNELMTKNFITYAEV